MKNLALEGLQNSQSSQEIIFQDKDKSIDSIKFNDPFPMT